MKNEPYKIETIDRCNKFLDGCRKRGYKFWRMQYRWSAPEGFHAWFMLAGEPDIEVVTHNKQVQDALVAYNK